MISKMLVQALYSIIDRILSFNRNHMTSKHAIVMIRLYYGYGPILHHGTLECMLAFICSSEIKAS